MVGLGVRVGWGWRVGWGVERVVRRGKGGWGRGGEVVDRGIGGDGRGMGLGVMSL